MLTWTILNYKNTRTRQECQPILTLGFRIIVENIMGQCHLIVNCRTAYAIEQVFVESLDAKIPTATETTD